MTAPPSGFNIKARCSPPYSSSDRYSWTNLVKSFVSMNVSTRLYVNAGLRQRRIHVSGARHDACRSTRLANPFLGTNYGMRECMSPITATGTKGQRRRICNAATASPKRGCGAWPARLVIVSTCCLGAAQSAKPYSRAITRQVGLGPFPRTRGSL